ncbi:MAG: CAP-associated domain-containing protein [Oscillospiraceae bacterium]|nr:CAP-associated domain-containing protein [Oscillospiraceae bacterium]
MKMKYKRLISLILIIVMIIGAAPVLAAQAFIGWDATNRESNMAGFFTPSAARDPRAYFTRAEVAELVVLMVERALGEPLPIPTVNPFSDTNDINVLKASYYGIVLGVGDGLFAPTREVQRQDFCTMIIRGIRSMERDLNRTLLEQPAASTLPFRDANMVQDHALEPVRLALSNGIMVGDGTGNDPGNFNPRRSISAQECALVIRRVSDMIEVVLARGAPVATLLDMAYRRVNIGFAYGDAATGVTRNLQLPTTSTGNATVSWQSNNPSVISPAGIVNLAGGAQNVTLTATISIGTQTRTKAFPLRTSMLSGNQLLMQNAFDTLDIIYLNADDNADSVTGRIALPTTVMGLPVTWVSNNPTVVTNTGLVTIPPNAEVRTATLTATINNAGQTRTKTFTLRVVNPAFVTRTATLHGVGIGMTPVQVAQILGTPTRTIAASATESWQLYHTNFSNFIAVAIVGNRVVAVYSMAPNVMNNLRNDLNAPITLAQANAIPGVTAVAYNDGGATYAVMISDTASPLIAGRALLAEGQEQLMLSLVNAFRVRNNLAVLEWSPELGTASRTHSTEVAVSTPTQTIAQRAATAGYPGNRFVGGNVLTGNNDAFDFFSQMVASPTMRTEILNVTATVLGTGFQGGVTIPGRPSGAMTYMLGIGAAYAGRLSVDFDGRRIADSSPSLLPPTLVMGAGEMISLTAATDLSGTNITWQVIDGFATINLTPNTSGTVATITAGGVQGTATITATVQTGTLTNITHTFRIEVVSLAVTMNNQTPPMAFVPPAGSAATSATVTPGFGMTTSPMSWSWVSANPAVVNVAGSPTMANWTSTATLASPVGAAMGTTAAIHVTASWDTATHLGSATSLLTVTIGYIPTA